MNARAEMPIAAPSLAAAIDAACDAIAPTWPLDRQIAVNPYWGFIDRPFAQAAAELGALVGARFTLDAKEYLRAWHSGEIDAPALTRAIAEQGVSATVDDAVAALQSPQQPSTGLPLLSDWIDRQSAPGAGPKWRDTITQQVSQYCASYFDEHQADWRPVRAAGFFKGWRNGLRADLAIEPLMHARAIRARTESMPETAQAALRWALDRLDVPAGDATDFLKQCLWRINGWASWCAYLRWQARLTDKDDTHVCELLAIRVCWEALLHDGRRDAGNYGGAWREAWLHARNDKPKRDTWGPVWQRAHELSYQARLVRLLETPRDGTGSSQTPPPAAQLAFCIDTRSERFRRILEGVDPALETLGFAGFFGLPLRFTPIGAPASRPQLPGLLAPTIQATESTGDASADAALVRRRLRGFRMSGLWQPLQRMPSAAFPLVETLGLGYAASILLRHFGVREAPTRSVGLPAHEARRLRPQLCIVGDEAVARKADLVASILRAMSLTSGFARLLVLVGHGSQSDNNPQAAALDCGACGGHSGEVNARILAGLINDPSVRAALAGRGIAIPESTLAIAGLHNTTTDEVRLFDADLVPDSHRPDLQQLQRSLAEAGRRTRAERAPSLGLASFGRRAEVLRTRMRRRARDWAQTRPEWGLAGNAALIVAPRSRTRGLDLGGRCFLHEYQWTQDPDGKVLELIMTAPMVVAHWINMQYYASTVDPERLGSGNKVLHNVVCGRIGVFEGNTGDLRIGLARQSVHDGARTMHAPLRLSVILDAPRSMIERVLAAHATARHLVAHRWLYLLRFAEQGIERFDQEGWQAWASGRQNA